MQFFNHNLLTVLMFGPKKKKLCRSLACEAKENYTYNLIDFKTCVIMDKAFYHIMQRKNKN